MKQMMNKTCLFFVLFSNLLFQTQGQNDTINRTTTGGLKYGFWQEYFQNGNIKTEGEYKIFKQPFSEEELFFFGIPNPDSLHSRSIKTGLWNEYNIHGEKIRSEFYKNGIQVYSEQYIYDENGKFLKKINNILSHRYAYKKDFEINPLFFDQIGPIGSRKINYLKIESLSDTLTKVILMPSSKNISLLFSTYVIEPYSSLSIPVLYLIKQGVHRDTLLVRLINFETYNHNVIIESYGYTLTSGNFQNSDDNLNTNLINSEKLYYFREYDECEMRIYKYLNGLTLQRIRDEKVKPVLIVPLSLKKNEINIKELDNGSYLLHVIDFKKNINLLTIIRKE